MKDVHILRNMGWISEKSVSDVGRKGEKIQHAGCKLGLSQREGIWVGAGKKLF